MTPRLVLMRIAAIMAAIMMLAGCGQRELCYDHSHGSPIDVTFDWSLAPDASPSTMVVWAFPDDGSQGQRFEFPFDRRSSSSVIKLTPGTYSLLCYNGDTEFNREGGYTLSDLHILTEGYSLLAPLNRTEEAPRPPLTANEPVRSPASHLYSHTLESPITILPTDAASGVTHKVTFTPRRATAVWNVRIEDIVNFSSDLQASAIITGAAERWNLADASPAGVEVTVPFPLTTCSEGCLKGSVVVFGDAAPHDVIHHLRVYTIYKYYYDYDITDQIHSAPDPANVDIVVKGMTLPSSGSGMSPGLSDWEDSEEINIEM